MGKINVGINGFGRIGRMVFRASLHRNDIDVVAINDLLDIDHLIYLLKYDSVHGNCDASITADDDGIIVNGQKIVILSEKNPSDINCVLIDEVFSEKSTEVINIKKSLIFT